MAPVTREETTLDTFLSKTMKPFPRRPPWSTTVRALV